MTTPRETVAVAVAFALATTPSLAQAQSPPRATGLDAGAYLGVGGPGVYSGVDFGLRHRQFEAGLILESASSLEVLSGGSVSGKAAYVGAGWEPGGAGMLHVAGVAGEHSWRGVGSTGLFSPGVSGETSYAGARVLWEVRSERPVSFGIGVLLMVTDDLTRSKRPVPTVTFFGAPETSTSTRTVGEADVFLGLRVSVDLGWLSTSPRRSGR